MNIIRIGWDIGGAQLKYCVYDSKSDVIWFDILDIDFWKDFKKLKTILSDIIYEYESKNHTIVNIFTMSAEMCDCFPNRSEGVNFIIKQIKKLKYKSYIFTTEGLRDVNKINSSSFDNVASANWYATAVSLKEYHRNAIAVDFGSTTCDFIIIKNGIIMNKRVSDISGIQNHELLYTGCLRTPIYAHLNSINLHNNTYSIIPENFSTMADVYVVLNKIIPKNIYSKSPDGKAYTKLNSLSRIARSFGFDYTKSSESLIRHLASNIFKNQMKTISKIINLNIKKYFHLRSPFSIIGLGIGHNHIKDICKSEAHNYSSTNKMLAKYIKNSDQLLEIYPAFVLSQFNDEI